MKELNKETFDLGRFAEDLGEEFNDKAISHKKFGKGIVKGFRASSGIIFQADFEGGEARCLSWDVCMRDGLLESDPVASAMRSVYDSYTAVLKTMDADRRAEAQKREELKRKEAEERKEKERYDAYVKSQTARMSDYLESAHDAAHSDSDDWIKDNIKCISAQVPDFLSGWFRRVFPDASYSVVDSHRRTSGGYRMKWGLSLSAAVKHPETAPSWIATKIKNGRVTDVGTLFDIAVNNGVRIGK